jgi:FkbM family methyltransferase
MLARAKSWYYAVKVAKKHCINYSHLLLKALLDKDGTFRSRKGGTISCKAKALLKQLVRLENTWSHYNDTLEIIGFANDSLVIPNYFGRDFRIPINTIDIAHPSVYLKHYPFDVAGDIVLDVGAYLGDTPLMWLYKKAEKVIAVEPVPTHFQYLIRNVEGLPVICLNAALGVQPKKMPSEYVSSSYGLQDYVDGEVLDVPAIQLTEVVERYNPTVVKLDCEGCEYYVLEQLAELPSVGVKKIAVEFHKVRNYTPYVSIAILEEKLGRSAIKTYEIKKTTQAVTVYWSW